MGGSGLLFTAFTWTDEPSWYQQSASTVFNTDTLIAESEAEPSLVIIIYFFAIIA